MRKLFHTGLGGSLPSSGSGWNGNGGHSRGGGPSNNGRHHSLPHQFGNSPASMMLNSYCTMTNSKSRLYLSPPPFNQLTCVSYYKSILLHLGERKGLQNFVSRSIPEVYSQTCRHTNTQPAKPAKQSELVEWGGGQKNIHKKES